MKPSNPAHAKGKFALLPRLSWFDVVAQTPALVLDSTAFFLTSDCDQSALFFLFENARYGLLPSQTLEEIEGLYLDCNARELERYKEVFLRRVVDARIKSLQEMAAQQVEKQTLAFLIKELIPYFLALDGEVQVPNRLLQTPRAKKMDLAVSKASPARCPLKEVMGPWSLVLDAKLYTLTKVKPIRGMDLVVRIGKDCWGIQSGCYFLEEVETAWMERLRQKLEQEAQAEAPDRMTLLRQMDAELHELVEYLERTPLGSLTGEGYLYQGRDRGIMRQNGLWVIYLDVPEYVVEDQNGTLYKFDATRVGITCKSCKPEEVIAPGKACVFTTYYEHMFVNTPAPGASICMVKDASYFGDLRKLSLAQALCTYLHDARQTLIAGHHEGNTSAPYHSITTFAHRRITLQDAEKKKLPIFRYHR